jgi:hypothetical protein
VAKKKVCDHEKELLAGYAPVRYIRFAFNNSKMIELLKERGKAIREAKFEK